MRSPEAFAPALGGCAAVFHTAAYFREYYQPGDHAEALAAVNVRGTLALMALADDAGVCTFVHTSSSGTIGSKPDGSPGDEEIDFATFRRCFRILMIDLLEAILMPPVLKVITEKAPGIVIESLSGFRVDFVNEIMNGTLDLGFYVFPVNAPEIVTASTRPKS